MHKESSIGSYLLHFLWGHLMISNAGIRNILWHNTCGNNRSYIQRTDEHGFQMVPKPLQSWCLTMLDGIWMPLWNHTRNTELSRPPYWEIRDPFWNPASGHHILFFFVWILLGTMFIEQGCMVCSIFDPLSYCFWTLFSKALLNATINACLMTLGILFQVFGKAFGSHFNGSGSLVSIPFGDHYWFPFE